MANISDKFKFIIPAELEKSKDGSYKVHGLASTQTLDQQGELIVQKGMDLTPIDKKKGILNWDHKAGPENTIGLLDAYTRTDKGLFVKGRLFKNHTKAKAVREIMESLSEGDRGRMGMSVEGKILERDPKNSAIIKKCRISAVALTMNPVNADTYADVVKSMSASETIEFDSNEDQDILAEDGEATFTTDQVLNIVKKALSVTQNRGETAPNELAGGSAMETSNIDSPKKKKKKEAKSTDDADAKKPVNKLVLKAMSSDLYKASMITMLDKLQILYPDNSRSEIWEAVKDRINTKFPDINVKK